jgi:AraC-like DNA-binding protein
MPANPQPSVFLARVPAAPLNYFVQSLLYWEGDPPSHDRDRLMPDGTASLIINLAEDEVRMYEGAGDSQMWRLPGAVLVGAHSRYTVIDSQEQRAIVAVAFRPGGTWPFFDPASSELHNQHTSISDLWRRDGHTLRERVLCARSPAARLAVLERELLMQAVRPLVPDRQIVFATSQLIQSCGSVPINALSECTGLSMKVLSRLFKLRVGLTPKLFARIRRFENMLQTVGSNTAVDWSTVAAECGYFDQSHLIRECALIAGFTPVELLAKRRGESNHFAV